MDFSLPPRAAEHQERAERFVREVVIPLEDRTLEGLLPPELLANARSRAKEAGLWAPHLPVELGGQGLDLLEAMGVLEAAGQSLLGPLVLGCAAPDEGNAHLLILAGSERQKVRYLKPLAAGEIRSTFAMTEPAPGAGSDPTMMRARAERESDGWVVDGIKWFATGASGAAFAIVAAVSDPQAAPRDGLTLFLVDGDNPGMVVERRMDLLGGGTPGGHCQVVLRKCRVPADAVLGAAGQGYRLIQERLGPARLTHCMRWLGAARRSLEIAARRARERRAFGKTLAEHQAVAWMLADSDMDLRASRLLVQEAAWRIIRGERARRETSTCKVFVAEAVNRVIDRAIQVCGALGLSSDLPLSRFYQEARAFRIYDGPSEVHRMVVARSVLGDLDRKPEGRQAAGGP
jgi:acyl-CoA dehydrogenase